MKQGLMSSIEKSNRTESDVYVCPTSWINKLRSKWSTAGISVIGVFFFLAITLSGCIKEQFTPELISTNYDLSASVALPIGKTTMSLQKIIEEEGTPDALYEDANGFFTLFYEDQVFSFTAMDFIEFPTISQTQTLNNELPIDLDLRILTEPMTFNDSLNFDFSFSGPSGDERLDSIVLDNAHLLIDPEGYNGVGGSLTVRFPGIYKQGIPLEVIVNLDAPNYETDLTGYTISLYNNMTETNQVSLDYELVLDASNAVIPAGGKIMDFYFEFSIIDFNALYGYVGTHDIDIPGRSMELPIFDEFVEGNFHFEAPVFKIKTGNSYGLPLQIAFTQLEAETRDTPEPVAITGSEIPLPQSPKILNSPTLEQVGQIAYDSLYFTNQTCNVFDVLELVPSKITYAVNGVINPDGQKDNSNFLLDTSRYDVSVELELPIWGYADFLVMSDTLKFNLNDFYQYNIDEVKRVAFVLNFTNSFPISIATQIYFMDENMNMLDSMFTDTRLIDGGIDNNGDGITDPTVNDPFFVEITQDKLEQIQDTRYLVAKGLIYTTGAFDTPPLSVRFHSSYAIDAVIGIIVSAEANTSQLQK